jgi:hypothetical protein
MIDQSLPVLNEKTIAILCQVPNIFFLTEYKKNFHNHNGLLLKTHFLLALDYKEKEKHQCDKWSRRKKTTSKCKTLKVKINYLHVHKEYYLIDN